MKKFMSIAETYIKNGLNKSKLLAQPVPDIFLFLNSDIKHFKSIKKELIYV